jgi:hypothetical protein
LANLGAFIGGQTPQGQFGSISGAQGGAAPYSATGYQTPTINEGQATQQGVNNAFDLYNINAANQVNPFVAGLSGAANLAGTAFNLGYSPWNQPVVGANTSVVGAPANIDTSSMDNPWG